MNEHFIRDRISKLSKDIDDASIESLKKQNQSLQDFVIWLCGYLDGNISKRGEGKV